MSHHALLNAQRIADAAATAAHHAQRMVEIRNKAIPKAATTTKTASTTRKTFPGVAPKGVTKSSQKGARFPKAVSAHHALLHAQVMAVEGINSSTPEGALKTRATTTTPKTSAAVASKGVMKSSQKGPAHSAPKPAVNAVHKANPGEKSPLKNTASPSVSNDQGNDRRAIRQTEILERERQEALERSNVFAKSFLTAKYEMPKLDGNGLVVRERGRKWRKHW